MAPSPRRVLRAAAVLAAAAGFSSKLVAFVAGPAPSLRAIGSPPAAHTALAARGGGEYDVSDADIEQFYQETISGAGGLPTKGNVVSELIVKHYHGEFTPQGFKRYAGNWKGPPPGGIGKKDIEVGYKSLKEQMAKPMYVTKGGGGPGADETQKVEDDGKGWVWLAADMSPGGLAVGIYKSVPYGKRPLLVAKQNDVEAMFEKVNWAKALERIDLTMGGPKIIQR
jgi:hypothetical protein